MSADKIIEKFEVCLHHRHFDRLEGLIDCVDPGDFSEQQITQALKLLKGKRRFRDIEKLGGVFLSTGRTDVEIFKNIAQAQIEGGRLNVAIAALTNALGGENVSDVERSELGGLLGRAFKQKYVESGESSDLLKAIGNYHEGWHNKGGDHRWHGINLAALMALADRQSIDSNIDEDNKAIAQNILTEIDKEQTLYPWDYATAMEASIALDDYRGASRWAYDYVTHQQTDAFELGSTLRQMQEIWNLHEVSKGRPLVNLLQSELLSREGGQLEAEDVVISSATEYEAVFGEESYKSVSWMEGFFKKFPAIAKVVDCDTEEAGGTGFVVAAKDINAQWGEGLVFLTNSHVVSDDPRDMAPLDPEDACAKFTRASSDECIKFGEKLFHSPRTELDVWICRMELPESLGVSEALNMTTRKPVVAEEGQRKQRIFVIGHPKGGSLSVSFYGNELAGFEDQYVRYESPTAGGSSGSPVMNEKLKTFAIHHAAQEALRLNEGILLESIANSI